MACITYCHFHTEKCPTTCVCICFVFINFIFHIFSKHDSPSPPAVFQRRIDFKEKISDTSLFAELVKDKHKRAKVKII